MFSTDNYWRVRFFYFHIVDEIDLPQDDFHQNSQGKIITSGDRNLKDLYKHFDIDTSTINPISIASHIMEMSKKIPLYGDYVTDKFFNYRIISHSRKQISKIEISRLD